MTPLNLLPAALLALLVHEWAHGLVGSWMGDPLPKWQGRTWPNPLTQLSLVGSCLVPLVLVGVGAPPIGWGKTIQFTDELRGRRLILTLAAGPASNVWLAGVLLFAGFPSAAGVSLAIGAVNLLPFGGLDGARMLREWRRKRIEKRWNALPGAPGGNRFIFDRGAEAMSEKVKPALTPEEWDTRHFKEPYVGYYEIDHRGDVVVWADEGYHRVRRPEALAALCLQASEHGFTSRHVGILRSLISFAPLEVFTEQMGEFRELVEIVEALLPPKPTSRWKAIPDDGSGKVSYISGGLISPTGEPEVRPRTPKPPEAAE